MDRITTFERAGLSFDVRDEGPVEGEVVVLLHGFPQLNTVWSKVAPLLHAAGYRTLAPNQRGYSAKARPSGRRPYRISEIADDVHALVDRIGTPVHLVGHDWGAVAAWEAAGRHPDDLRSLVAVSIPHPAAYVRAALHGQLLRSWYMAAFNLPAIPERIMTGRGWVGDGFTDLLHMRPDARARYVAEFRNDLDRTRGALGWYRALPLQNMRGGRGDVTVPTTYIWSDRDPYASRAAAEACGRYVDAPYRFAVITGASHWLPDEEPRALAELIVDRAAGVSA